MSNQSKHDPNNSLAQLKQNLRGSEALRGAIVKIVATSNELSNLTAADHEFLKPVPVATLGLDPDPDGKAKPPAGTSLVTRGSAWIGGQKSGVILYRLE